MPLDAISNERLALVHPELGRRFLKLSDAMEAQGYQMRVTQGIRSVAQQNALYAQGRTAPGEIVTNAQGAESNHVLGYAVDFVIMANGQPDWNSPGFDVVVQAAPSYGLRSGASWGDKPHLELPEYPTKPTAEMQAIYKDAGVMAVWQQFPIAT